MSMIKCPECGGDVSDKAKKCIHCGKILVEEQKNIVLIAAKKCLLMWWSVPTVVALWMNR